MALAGPVRPLRVVRVQIGRSSRRRTTDWKVGCGSSACPVWREGGRTTASPYPYSELIAQREELTAKLDGPEPPLVDSRTVMTYRRETEKVIASGHPAERKRLIRTWVNEVRLEPQTLEVKINYRLPEAVMKGVVAGAGFEPATFGL